MKLITTLIQPEKFENVKKMLFEKNINKMTVTNVLGCGQQAGYHENYRGAVKEINLLKKIKLEIAVNDEFVEEAIQAIIASAKSGKIGDGKIFVMPIEDCIRIRTEERGTEAIG